MPEYTPDTEIVRLSYIDRQDFLIQVYNLDRLSDEQLGEQFDRWLEQHDMEIREETRQEAYHDGYSRGFEDGYGEGFAAHDFYDDWVYNAEDNE